MHINNNKVNPTGNKKLLALTVSSCNINALQTHSKNHVQWTRLWLYICSTTWK